MEISALPGTSLALEPGGLDAPPSREENQGGTGSSGGEQENAENGAGEGKASAGEEGQGPAEEDNQGEEADEEGEEEEKARNRVIVRRRATRGGGFFTRKDAVAPGGAGPSGMGLKEASRSTTAIRPKYSTIRSGIIKLTPESMKCKLYCRGAKCIYCNPENWTEAQQAIRGLFSSWVGEKLLAMARPTERTFEEFDLIGQFKKAKVKTILNLQSVNEHDYCGAALLAHTGFSYDPEVLMRRKFFYYNFSIPDFGTVPVQSLLNIVKVIWFSLRFGRVAIHCHAGLGRTGTLIACFLVWSKGLYTSDAIEFVRVARPNSIQSIEQINVVEEFAFHVHKYGTALPSAFYSSSNGISLRQLMANQRTFLPNEQARHFAHIPKLLFMLGDRLLRLVFEENGIHYSAPCGHHARSCTFGTIRVNWRNAFIARGKLQVRQVVNLLARCSAFPYEKDQPLIGKFQQLSLVTIDQLVKDMDTPQLISLLNAFMDSIKKPYCSRKSLIDALGHFSPDNPTGPIPKSDEEDSGGEGGGGGGGQTIGNEDLELVNQLIHPRQSSMEAEDLDFALSNEGGHDGLDGIGTEEGETEKGRNAGPSGVGNVLVSAANEEEETIAIEEVGAGSIRPGSAFKGAVDMHSLTMENCAQRYGGAQLADGGSGEDAIPNNPVGPDTLSAGAVAANERSRTVKGTASSSAMAVSLSIEFGALQFDNHDSHTNKEANLNADWHCIVFYVCNVLSYLTGENYDSVVDLLTFWFTGDSNRDVKQALYCHMRDLFARNMRQQEQQAAEWRRLMGLPEKPTQAKKHRG